VNFPTSLIAECHRRWEHMDEKVLFTDNIEKSNIPQLQSIENN
jgi:hypothetical protein